MTENATKPPAPESHGTPETNKAIHRRGWFQTLVVLGVLFAVLLAALPFGVSYGVKYALKQAGAEESTVRDVDLNLFTGTLALKNVTVDVGNKRTLTLPHALVRLSWRALIFNRRIVVEEILVEDMELFISRREDGEFYVAGLSMKGSAEPEPELKADTKPFIEGFGVQRLSIENVKLHYTDPKLETTLHIGEMVLEKIQTWNADRAAHLGFQGKLDSAPIRMDLDLKVFGDVRTVKGSIKVDKLALETFAELAKPAVAPLEGLASTDAKIDITHSSSNLAVVHDGSLNLAGLEIGLEDGTVVKQPSLGWKGTTHLALAMPDGAPAISAEGKLDAGKLALALPALKLDIGLGKLGWNGKFAQSADDPPVLKVQGQLSLQEVGVEDTGHAVVLADLRRLDARDIAIQGLDDIKVASIELNELNALEPAQAGGKAPAKGKKAGAKGQAPVVQAKLIRVNRLSLTTMDKLGLDEVRVVDLNAFVHVLQNGRMDILDDLAGKAETAKEKPAKPAKGKSRKANPPKGKGAKAKAAKPAPAAKGGTADLPIQIRVGEFDLAGDSKVRYLDESLKPDLDVTLTIEKLTLTDLDSSNPDQPSKLDFHGRTGKYSKITINGTVQPFASDVTLDLKNKIQSLDVAYLSSFTAGMLGYNLQSGALNADNKITIDHGQMDGLLKLTFIKLKLTPAASDAATKLSKELTMPLDKALGMLRDRHDNIQLEIPLGGDVHDPNVGLGDIINKALIGAVKEGGLTYLKAALFPYGTMLAVAEYAGEKLTRVSMEPVVFDAGQGKLPADAKKYLGKVAKVMVDRPEMNLSLCGRYVADDAKALQGGKVAKRAAPEKTKKKHWWNKKRKSKQETRPAEQEPREGKPETTAETYPEALVEKMVALARERAGAMKDALVAHGVPAERMLVCEPELDPAGDAKPRVDLLF